MSCLKQMNKWRKIRKDLSTTIVYSCFVYRSCVFRSSLPLNMNGGWQQEGDIFLILWLGADHLVDHSRKPDTGQNGILVWFSSVSLMLWQYEICSLCRGCNAAWNIKGIFLESTVKLGCLAHVFFSPDMAQYALVHRKIIAYLKGLPPLLFLEGAVSSFWESVKEQFTTAVFLTLHLLTKLWSRFS